MVLAYLLCLFAVSSVARASSTSNEPLCIPTDELQSLLQRKHRRVKVVKHVAEMPTAETRINITKEGQPKKDAVNENASPLVRKGKPSLLLCVGLLCVVILNMLLVWMCYGRETDGPDHARHALYNQNSCGKVYVYRNEQLLTWSVLLTGTPGLVLSWRVWIVGPCVLSLTFLCATLVVIQNPYTALVDTKRINQFGTYLRVFITFMLGLYMNHSFQRWHSSVSIFRQALNSVKQLIFAVRIMDVERTLVDELERKCVAACYMLDAEMRTDLGCKTENLRQHWENTWRFLLESRLLTEEEAKAMRSQHEGEIHIDMGSHTTMIWAWIGVMLSKIRLEKDFLTPMFMRLTIITQQCISQVDKLKTTAHVQVPFSYAYLLSTIVHLNSILLAVCSGFEIGLTMLEHVKDDNEPGTSLLTMHHAMKHTVNVHIQVFGIVFFQTLILLIQPIMYQACLVIAHGLNHPFGDDVFHLPTETFLQLLRDELRVSASNFRLHAPVSTDISEEEKSKKGEYQFDCSAQEHAIDDDSDASGASGASNGGGADGGED